MPSGICSRKNYHLVWINQRHIGEALFLLQYFSVCLGHTEGLDDVASHMEPSVGYRRQMPDFAIFKHGNVSRPAAQFDKDTAEFFFFFG